MYRNIYILFLFLFVAFACQKEALDLKPNDQISEERVWSDPNLTSAYLTGLYSIAPIHYVAADPASDNWLTITREMDDINFSDEGYWNWINSYPKDFSKGTLDNTGGFNEYWDYPAIRKFNEFILKVPLISDEVNYPAAKKAEWVAEARFLRAYAYFHLVKRYGGVPLVTEPQDITLPLETLQLPRSKEEDIYNFIISELTEAAADLPAVAADYGRATKYAALALKSRAALFAGSIAQFGTVELDGVVGIPAANAATFYQDAYDASLDIITNGGFALYNKYADKALNFQSIFYDERNSETIFAKQRTGPGGVISDYEFFQIPQIYHAWGGGQESGVQAGMIEAFENVDGSPTALPDIGSSLYTRSELFAKKDPRFKASVYTCGTFWIKDSLKSYNGVITEDGTINHDANYKGLLTSGTSNMAGSCFGVLKNLDPGWIAQWAHQGKLDWIDFRLGEIYLNLAEAAFELGKTAEALDAVNIIRTRAGVPELGEITRDAIRHERQVELAFEGHRYWDCRRWRIAVDKFSNDNRYAVIRRDFATLKYRVDVLPFTTPNLFLAKNYYLPITPARIGSNPKLVENPGY
jgi:hypothetical protein